MRFSYSPSLLLVPLMAFVATACGTSDDNPATVITAGMSGVAGTDTGVAGTDTGVAGAGVAGADTGAAGMDTGAAGTDTGAAGMDTGAAGMDTGAAGMDTGAAGMDTGGTDLCTAPREDDGALFIQAAEVNNYTFFSKVTPTIQDVAPNTDLTFDWSGMTENLFGKPVDPTVDVNSVGLVVWKVSETEFVDILNSDQLSSEYAQAPTQKFDVTGTTSANMFSFLTPVRGPISEEEFRVFLDPATTDPATHAYAVMPMTGDVLGQNTLDIQMFRLNPASTETVVYVTADSTSLEWDAELGNLTPTRVPANDPNLRVNWRTMTTNALGHPFTRRYIQRVIVGKYTQTPAELGEQFLELEELPVALYEGEVPAGDQIDLNTLVAADGTPFPGIDGEGTWILALQCGLGLCGNPAPWYLTVLESCQ